MSSPGWVASGLIALAGFAISGCDVAKLQEAQRLAAGASVSTSPTPIPSCGDFNEYDSYTDCVNGTNAYCSSEWQTFSNGGAGLCYYPVDGWESCTATTAQWIYTPYTATVCYDPVAGNYWKAHSVIGCSSDVCACLTAPTLYATCTMGVDCPVPTPSPMPPCP